MLAAVRVRRRSLSGPGPRLDGREIRDEPETRSWLLSWRDLLGVAEPACARQANLCCARETDAACRRPDVSPIPADMGETKVMGQPIIEAIGGQTNGLKSCIEVQRASPEEDNGVVDQNGQTESEGGGEDEEDPTPSQHDKPRRPRREEFWSSAPQLLEGGRRGASSLRLKHTDAFESCTFPAYPEDAFPQADFDLPRALLDNHAPASARKWCASPPAPPHPSAPPCASFSGDGRSDGTRVVCATPHAATSTQPALWPEDSALVGGAAETLSRCVCPASRRDLALSLASLAKDLAAKRQAAHERLVSGQMMMPHRADAGFDDYDNKRVRRCAALPTMRACAAPRPLAEHSRILVLCHRPTAIMRQNVEVARMMGVPGTKQKHLNADAMGGVEEKPQHLSSSRPRDRTPKGAAPDRPRQPNQYTYAGLAGSSACNGSGGAGPGGSSGSRSKRPVDTSPRCASTSGQKRSLPVISSLPAGFGADNGGPITGATVQLVLAEGAPLPVLPAQVLPLRRVAATIVTADPKDGKRKRRPPGWLEGHEQQGEEHVSEDETEAAPVPLPMKRKRSSPAVNVVHATLVDAKQSASAAAADGSSVQCVVTILGIASQSGSGGRSDRSPHEHAREPTPSSAERSPRPRASSEPSSARKERESSGDDAFQVYFGDLPSPRMIEVVKAKEVQLPSWRALPNRGAPQASQTLGRGARNAASAPADDGESSDEDTSDEVFERRHNRALERAVAAAKEWAAEMAQKERQKSSGAQSNADGGETGEEWRFRPSELAALCYAATRTFSGNSGDGDASRGGRGSFAGFFGSGGANRGAGPDGPSLDGSNAEAGNGDAANGSDGGGRGGSGDGAEVKKESAENASASTDEPAAPSEPA